MTWSFVFALAALVQLAYWAVLYAGFRRARRTAPAGGDAGDVLPPISVVVAARNEASRLPDLLAALAAQRHPAFEVVVVDDASTDATAALVRAWAAGHPNVRLVEHADGPRKKHALARGIAEARHELLALTDADCRPPPGWIAALAAAHAAEAGADEAGVVLVGYSPFRPGLGVLGRVTRYETFVTAFLTAAAVGLGRPYMAVGRNLSYSRALFRRIGGFAHSERSLSGDDDLLVQEIARRRAAPVRYVFAPDSFVPTDGPASWRAWVRQKRRHASAGRFYARAAQVHLAVFQGTAAVLWLAPLLAGWAGAAVLGAKLLAQGLALRAAARAFGERGLMPAFPLLDLCYAAYNALVAPLGLLKRPARW